jgi:hypothetical protein
MPQPVGFLVEAEWLFSIRSIGDDGLCPAIAQQLAQLGAVVSFVAGQRNGCLDATDETLRTVSDERRIERMPGRAAAARHNLCAFKYQ